MTHDFKCYLKSAWPLAVDPNSGQDKSSQILKVSKKIFFYLFNSCPNLHCCNSAAILLVVLLISFIYTVLWMAWAFDPTRIFIQGIDKILYLYELLVFLSNKSTFKYPEPFSIIFLIIIMYSTLKTKLIFATFLLCFKFQYKKFWI